MSTKVYKFKARYPGEAPLIREQMDKHRRYFNRLIEIENARRMLVWGGESPPIPPHDDCACDECKAHWKALRSAYREIGFLDLKPHRSEAAADGLFWGTYLLAEESYNQAARTTDCTQPVSFRSWRTGGQIGAQVQKSANPSNIFRIEDDPSDTRTGRRRRNGCGRKFLRVRVGSNGRSPIWSEPIPFIQHRPIEGRVVTVRVAMSYHPARPGHEEWTVLFTAADVPTRKKAAATGTVFVDVGWRKMDDGSLRMAYARDDVGDTWELRVATKPRWRGKDYEPSWSFLIDKADDIRSIRDKRVKELLEIEPCVMYDAAGRAVPPKNCAAAVRRLRYPLRAETAAWLKQERHLHEYEIGCRRRHARVVEDRIRSWACMLRGEAANLVMMRNKTKKMKERNKDQLPRPARRNAQAAAPGKVHEILMQVFGRDNTQWVEAPLTSRTCTVCDHVNREFSELMLVCERCGTVEDRDIVSTRNMKELWRRGETAEPTARKTSPKFAKRHKKTDEESQSLLDG